MIKPPTPTGIVGSGAVFTDAADGDIRNDLKARAAVADRLGVSGEWATLTQVHGVKVVRATEPGNWGEGDGLFTTVRELPLAVFTADCAGVVVSAADAVGVAHAGWRGAASGVVAALVATMTDAGHPPLAAAIGPTIGPCCFEVGQEVAHLFPGYVGGTSWGTTSVDLVAALAAQLTSGDTAGFQIWSANTCTQHEFSWLSHRRDKTESRMAAIGWLP